MNYSLNKTTGKAKLKFFWPFLKDEKLPMFIALIGILVSSALNLLAPVLIGRAIDTYIAARDLAGLSLVAGQLALVFFGAFIAGYVQTTTMGGVGQRVLYKLRNTIFSKLESLPVAFFNQNKAGDLISRINNDTDKLNQFFSQAIMQFVGNGFMIIGAGISLVSINAKLGLAVLVPALILLVITRVTSGLIKKKNAESLQATGSFSGAVQESLENFKVVVAFNRQDYFHTHLAESNEKNYDAALGAGVANTAFTPIYGLMGNAAQLIAITYGITLVMSGQLTVGLLVSTLTYISRFYDPVRQIASFWASWQSALAAADRIHNILELSSNMETVEITAQASGDAVLEFKGVNFSYPEGKSVLHNVNLAFNAGKTYALVGPTGGGKTTTASLAARLYDPTAGTVFLDGQDIRSYSADERTKRIGFILQDPFLFKGTVRDNVVYGNEKFANMTEEALTKHLEEIGLSKLLTRFDKGLRAEIGNTGGTLSAGQKQILAFMRAILREPKLLILDEATANIDTITEQLLGEALDALPKSTTRIIIAHRLNTIENADEIFFVNSGEIIPAGSLKEAIDMLLHKERTS
ncbi:MAG: ABC transporter ATP-binding protein [Patescibacteria group bacterium]|jgi:ATP-binding cassette subfamily B protein